MVVGRQVAKGLWGGFFFSMRVSIKYGSNRIDLEVPDDRFAGRWGMESASGSEAANTPGDGSFLSQAVSELGAAGFAPAVSGRTVGLLLADGTRKWNPEEHLPPLFALLRGAQRVIAFLATGTHDTESPENRRLALRRGGALGDEIFDARQGVEGVA